MGAFWVRLSRGWSVIIGTALALVSVGVTHSSSQATVINPSEIRVSSSCDLIGTPEIGEAISLPAPSNGAGSVLASVYLTNNLPDDVRLMAVSSSGPNVTATIISQQPVVIPPEGTSTAQVSFMNTGIPGPAGPIFVPLLFRFQWLGGTARIPASATVMVAPPSDNTTQDGAGASTDGS